MARSTARSGCGLKAEAPATKTIVVTLANGSANSGYIYSDEAYSHLTFQVIGSRLKPGCAEGKIVSTAIALMHRSGQSPLRAVPSHIAGQLLSGAARVPIPFHREPGRVHRAVDRPNVHLARPDPKALRPDSAAGVVACRSARGSYPSPRHGVQAAGMFARRTRRRRRHSPRWESMARRCQRRSSPVATDDAAPVRDPDARSAPLDTAPEAAPLQHEEVQPVMGKSSTPLPSAPRFVAVGPCARCIAAGAEARRSPSCHIAGDCEANAVPLLSELAERRRCRVVGAAERRGVDERPASRPGRRRHDVPAVLRSASGVAADSAVGRRVRSFSASVFLGVRRDDGVWRRRQRSSSRTESPR